MSINTAFFSHHWTNVFLLACFVTLTLAGCSSGGNSNTIASNNPQQAAGPLEGTWDLCGGLRNTYVFSGNTWQQYLAYFDNPECAGPPLPSDDLQSADEPFAAGTFELLGDVATDSGVVARALNLTTTTSDTAIRYDIVLTDQNGKMFFGSFAGFTEGERPVTLDFDAAYFRR